MKSVPPDVALLRMGGLVVDWSGPRGEPVVTVTLNRPKTLNSQTPSMWAALAHIGDALPEATRVVVLRGAGSAFSSGLDRSAFDPTNVASELNLVGLSALSDDELNKHISEFQDGFTWWHDRTDVISIAAVDGVAVGAGFQLALACDLRIGTSTSKFCMKEPALGLVPDLAGTHPLVRLIGYSRALEVCSTGRWIEANEALSWGLLNAVAPDGGLASTTESLVQGLLSVPVQALRETKALLASAMTAGPSEQRAHERSAQTRLIKGELAAGLSGHPGT